MQITWGGVAGRIAPAVVGAVAALLTVIVSERAQTRPGALETLATARTKAPSPERTIVVERRSDSAEIADLRRTISELQDRVDANATNETPPAEPYDREAALAHLEAEFGDLEATLANQPSDRSWSTEAEASVVGALTPLSEHLEISVGNADCRMTVCKVAVAWKSYYAARAHGAALAEVSLPGLNCVQKFWFKEPADKEAPYTSQLYLDCSELRAGQAGVARTF